MEKLKLLNVDSYWIIVNGEKIRDHELSFDIIQRKVIKTGRGFGRLDLRKLIASQNPEHNLPSITFSDEVAEELGIVNIATKGIIASEEFDDNHQCQNDFAFGFYSGYNQALSDNKDKLFTLEQMESCFFNGGGFKTLEEFNFCIQSITKQEYDCELEMYEPIKNSPSGIDRFINITYNSVKVIKLMK